MNEVTECLQYARGLTGLLAELLEDAEEVTGKDLSIALRAVEALMETGCQRAEMAHERVVWAEAESAA